MTGNRIIQLTIFFLIMLYLAVEPKTYASSTKPEDSGKIPDVLIGFHTEKSKAYALLVDKNIQRIYFYDCSDGFKKIFNMQCSTGKRPGPKNLSGDQKTPEGVYFFTNEFADQELSATYGLKAFPMDYPNFLDRAKGRNGHSIWMHGTDKQLKARNSNGCVALQNSDLQKLSKYITLNRTPIIIREKLSYISDDLRKKAEKTVLHFLKAWETALLSGTYHQYLSLYDPEYLPEITWWSKWHKLRSSFNSSGAPPLHVELKNTSILKIDSIYVVLSDLTVSYDNKETYICTKKNFIKSQPGQIKIIGEEYQSIPESFKTDGYDSSPLTAACGKIIKTLHADREIPAIIEGWLQAWSQKNIKAYGNYYAEDFMSEGMNKIKWLKKKTALNRNYKYIKVKKDNLKINRRAKNIKKVSFIQTYESDKYKAIGRKKLLLKLEKGKWKIYRESWAGL